MPIYLCKPGYHSSEPWKHVVQVYAAPFPMEDSLEGVKETEIVEEESGVPSNSRSITQMNVSTMNPHHPVTLPTSYPSASSSAGIPLRRVRHAEVVLVDSISVHYNRYWLRLVFPGPGGEYAGCIALGKVTPDVSRTPAAVRNTAQRQRHEMEEEDQMTREEQEAAMSSVVEAMSSHPPFCTVCTAVEATSHPAAAPPTTIFSNDLFLTLNADLLHAIQQAKNDRKHLPSVMSSRRRYWQSKCNLSREQFAALWRNVQEAVAMELVVSHEEVDYYEKENKYAMPCVATQEEGEEGRGSASFGHVIVCPETGLYFPSSAVLELLPDYDDGLGLGWNRRRSTHSSESSSRRRLADEIQRHSSLRGIHDDEIYFEQEGKEHNLMDDGPQEEETSGFCAGGGHVDGAETDVDADVDAEGEKDYVPIYGVEPVFCRICREGLHDVEWEGDAEAPGVGAAGLHEEAGGATNRGILRNAGSRSANLSRRCSANDSDANDETDAIDKPSLSHGALTPSHAIAMSGVDIARLQHLTSTHPSVENPLIAPCNCTGSMAFVHYLCVEQWRARSRHPDAQLGTHCETCKAHYSLPPPTLDYIPNNGQNLPRPGDGNDAWLDAMPPHVLAALREPHLWWQVGVAIVRRPLLRPLAPIILSPLVSLYCRARRNLKKRGVSRRRWSCSLCRRRARWKCVRCLRSYYCSRQCQNVSWHILHKHVCYKPSRFWGSVLFYFTWVLIALPGLRAFPLLYALGIFGCIPVSFSVTGTLGGSFAALTKKYFRVDLRGRYLELLVVGCTIHLAWLLWGLLWGFFGYPQYCAGITLGSTDVESEASTLSNTFLPSSISTTVVTFHSHVDEALKNYIWNPVGRMLTILNMSVVRKSHGKVFSIMCGSSTMKRTETVNQRDGAARQKSDHTSWRRWARQNLLQVHNYASTKEIRLEGTNVSAVTRYGFVRTSTSPPPVCFHQLEHINPNFTFENSKCAADVHFLSPIFLLCGCVLLWSAILRRRAERRVAAAAVAGRAAAARGGNIGRPIRMPRRRVVDAGEGGHLHQD